MESNADLSGRVDLRVEQAGPAGRKYVVVVGGGAAAGQRELRQPHGRRRSLPVPVDAGPHRVELAKPAEQALALRANPRQNLIEVMVGVDAPRQAAASPAVDAARTLRAGRPSGPN